MKKILPIIAITILTVLVGAVLSSLGPVRALDEAITDANIRYFAPSTKVSDDIVIVFLDEGAMKELPYRSPVPRDFLYKLNESIPGCLGRQDQ